MNDQQYETEKKKVSAVLDKWVKVLGMDYHYIKVFWERNKDEQRNHTMASTQADWQYRQMFLYFFLPRIAELDDDQLDNLILHELSHMLIRSAYTVEEYSDKVEYAVENVAHAIEDAFNAGMKAQAKLTKAGKDKDGKVAQEQKPPAPVAEKPPNS
jgi:hypothetical protein